VFDFRASTLKILPKPQILTGLAGSYSAAGSGELKDNG